MNRKTNLILLLLVLVFSILACSLPASRNVTSTPVEKNETANPTAPAGDNTGPEVLTPGEETPGAHLPGQALFLPVPDGTKIVQLTPETDNGERPLFAWEAVPGAEFYMLFLFGEAGAYWAWEGSQTTVILGGFDTPPAPGADGPRLLQPMQWAVVAVGENGHYVGSSPLRAVAP